MGNIVNMNSVKQEKLELPKFWNLGEWLMERQVEWTVKFLWNTTKTYSLKSQ